MLDSRPPCRGPLYPLVFVCIQDGWINHNDSVPVGAGNWKWTPVTVSSLQLSATDWLNHRRSSCVYGTWAGDWQLITQHWTILPLWIERVTLIMTGPYLLSTGDSFLILCLSLSSVSPSPVLSLSVSLTLSHLLPQEPLVFFHSWLRPFRSLYFFILLCLSSLFLRFLIALACLCLTQFPGFDLGHFFCLLHSLPVSEQ